MASQLSLFIDSIPTVAKFPSTRYQGSKQKFVDWIWDCVKDIPFRSALDAFGGTGSVSFRLKEEGKRVTYNDILPFNHIIGKALIENEDTCLEDFEVDEDFWGDYIDLSYTMEEIEETLDFAEEAEVTAEA